MSDVAVQNVASAREQLPTRTQLLGALAKTRRSGGYTEDSVERVVDGALALLNRLAGDYDEAQARLANSKPSSEEADRLADEARELFEETQATAAHFLANARERAANIEADAAARAERTVAEAQEHAEATVSAAQAEATRLTEETTTWANDLRETTERELTTARETAAAELAESSARRERLDAESADIFYRLDSFYTQQLENLRAVANGEGSAHLVPSEEEAPVETEVEPVADKHAADDAQASDIPVEEPVAADR